VAAEDTAPGFGIDSECRFQAAADAELLTEPVAVFIGAEGGGLGRLVTERLDVVVSIPMAGESESLNASVAAALACFEVHRARSMAQAGS